MSKPHTQSPRLRRHNETAPKRPIDMLMKDLTQLAKQEKGARINVCLTEKLDKMSIRTAIRDLGTFSDARFSLEEQPDGTIDVIRI